MGGICYFPNNWLGLGAHNADNEAPLYFNTLEFVVLSSHCWQLGIQNKNGGQFHAADLFEE